MNNLHWRHLLETALENNTSPSTRFFTVANVDEQGKPQARTMVYRGLCEQTLALLSTTDARSDKVKQLLMASSVHICWYFSDTWEQFRITATAKVLKHDQVDSGDAKVREDIWQTLSNRAKLSFQTPYNEAALQVKRAYQESLDLAHNQHSGEEPKHDMSNYVALMFIPEQIDYLNLKTEPNTQYHFTKPFHN